MPKRWSVLRGLLIVCGLAALCAPPAAARPRPREQVFAYWEDDGYWYPAEIEETDGDQVQVRFLDDGTRKTLPPGQVVEVDVNVGADVQANWKDRGKYYSATIVELDGDHCVVRYDEDGVEERVHVRQLRVMVHARAGGELHLGEFVFGWWSSDGYWYPGRIERIDGDRYRIRFDDGEAAWLSAEEVSLYSVQPDEWIEVSQAPKKRFYRALVTARRGRTLHVEYEDGSTEKVDLSRVRADLGSP